MSERGAPPPPNPSRLGIPEKVRHLRQVYALDRIKWVSAFGDAGVRIVEKRLAAEAPTPQTESWLARDIGLTFSLQRQPDGHTTISANFANKRERESGASVIQRRHIDQAANEASWEVTPDQQGNVIIVDSPTEIPADQRHKLQEIFMTRRYGQENYYEITADSDPVGQNVLVDITLTEVIPVKYDTPAA